MSKKRSPHPDDPATQSTPDQTAQSAETGPSTADQSVAEQKGERPTSDSGTEKQAAEALTELREEADRLVQEVAEVNDKYLRVVAELENTRRRTQAELSEAHKFAIKGFAEEVVNVRDSLELAQAWEPGEGETEVSGMREGLETTLKQLDQALEKFAIKVVAPQPGDKLDPNLHQAMTTQESNEIPPNHVLNVIRKGYTIHERLLRPAMVVVARAAEAHSGAKNTAAEEPEDA